MIRVYIKEIHSFLNSLIAYIIMTVFLTGMGLILWVFPESSILDYGYADMGSLFSLAPYIFIFMIPAITMRMFAEEKKSGTIEFLFTKPLTDTGIILGKYLAGLTIVVFTLAPTVIYYLTVRYLGNPPGNIDTAGTAGSYIGLILLGAAFTAIGIFASSLSENQVVAFIIAVFISFILYSGLRSIATIDIWGKYSDAIDKLGMIYNYNAMSKGLIDSRNVIYFLSVITIALLFTKLKISSRKW